MGQGMDGQRSRGLALVFAAGVLYSTAGLFTRMLHLDAWTILAWRAVFGALFTFAWLVIQHGRHTLGAFSFSAWQWAKVPLIATGGICYIFALKVTAVADVMVIYATMPFVTAAVAWVWGRDVPSRRMVIASLAALIGVAVMMVGGYGSGARLLGAALTLLMNVTFAILLVGARRQPGSTVALFTVGTTVNAVVAFGLAPPEAVNWSDMGILAAFGFSTIGLAMVLYMAGARMIPPVEVGLVGIVDVVIGPALVWLWFNEDPGLSTVFGGAIVVGALIWHLLPDLRQAALSRRSAAPSGSGDPCPDRGL